jgi:hypothetical protein
MESISVWAGDSGTIGRCFRTLYLGEVAANGLSLPDQAAWIATWARRAFDHINGQAPSV